MITRIIKFLAIKALQASAIFFLIVFIPNLPPHSRYSEPYTITPAPPFEGKLALNERLNNAEILFKSKIHGPEAFAVYNGELYTGIVGGDVVKIVGSDIIPVVKFGKPCKGAYQEHICGRPLGLTFDKSGALYVADAYYGIFKVDVKTGKYEQLVSMDEKIGDKKPKLPNGVAVASNGDVYWTDSSSDFSLADGVLEILSDGNGRVFHYDAKTKKNRILLNNLKFPNGILLTQDESFIIISESGYGRLIRYYLKGAKKGTHDVFLDGIPGMPDNLQSDGQGGFFAPLVVSYDQDNPSPLQIFSQFPLLRRFIARIQGLTELLFKFVDHIYPNEWAERAISLIGSFHCFWNLTPTPKRITILHISESGRIIDSLHALDRRIDAISDAIVVNDALYLGSPYNQYLGKVSLTKSGLKHLITEIKTSTTLPPSQKEAPEVNSLPINEASRTTKVPVTSSGAPTPTSTTPNSGDPKERPTNPETPATKVATENTKTETKRPEPKIDKVSPGKK